MIPIPRSILVFAFLVAFSGSSISPAAEQPATVVYESSDDGAGTDLPYLKNALDALAISYTYRTGADLAPFKSDLASGSFAVAMVNSSSVDISTALDELEAFFDGGGRLLIFLWGMHLEPNHSLWAKLGALFEGDLSIAPPQAIAIVAPTHPIVSTPNAVGEISLSNADLFGNFGDLTSALSRGLSVATADGGGAADSLIIARRDGKAVLNTFLPANYIGDEDMGDLLENEITWVLGTVLAEDFEVDPTPFLSDISPPQCFDCSSDLQPSGCYCDADCIAIEPELGRCCVDACLVCGSCQP